MSELLSYAKARDFVGANLGEGVCPPDDAQLEVLMVNCLQRIYADVSDDKHYQGITDLALVDGQCEYDLPFNVFTSVQDENCRDLEYCRTPPNAKQKQNRRKPGIQKTTFPTVASQRVYPCGSNPCQCEEECPASIKPTSWACYANQLIVFPAPVVPAGGECVITIRGRRYIDCTLYDMIDGVKHWRIIDLPPKYHTIFAKCLLAFSLGVLDDQARANWWFQVSRDELEAVKCQDDELTFQPDDKLDEICCVSEQACDFAPGCAPKCDNNDRLQWEFEEVDGRVHSGCC